MLSFEDAQRMLADPTITAQDLHNICSTYPNLQAQALNHPAMYPELRQWIATTNPNAIQATQQTGLQTAQQIPTNTYTASGLNPGQAPIKKPLNKKLIFGIGGGVVALIIVLVVSLTLLGGGSDIQAIDELTFTKNTTAVEITGIDKIVKYDPQYGYFATANKLYKLTGDKFVPVKNINVNSFEEFDVHLASGYLIKGSNQIIDLTTGKELKLSGMKVGAEEIDVIDHNHIVVGQGGLVAMFDSSGNKKWEVNEANSHYKLETTSPGNTFLKAQDPDDKNQDPDGVHKYIVIDNSTGKTTEITMAYPTLVYGGFVAPADDNKFYFYNNALQKIGEVQAKNSMNTVQARFWLLREYFSRASIEDVYKTYQEAYKEKGVKNGYMYVALSNGTIKFFRRDMNNPDNRNQYVDGDGKIYNCEPYFIANGKQYACVKSLKENRDKFETTIYEVGKTEPIVHLPISIPAPYPMIDGRWISVDDGKLYVLKNLG